MKSETDTKRHGDKIMPTKKRKLTEMHMQISCPFFRLANNY